MVTKILNYNEIVMIISYSSIESRNIISCFRKQKKDFELIGIYEFPKYYHFGTNDAILYDITNDDIPELFFLYLETKTKHCYEISFLIYQIRFKI